MRSERIVTNLVCNQNCRFCNSRSAADDRAFIQPAAVRQRIQAAVAGGARELILTGGEPTLRKDLPALVAFARAAGAGRITLETNGTVIDPAGAAVLREAGLTAARVNVCGLVDKGDLLTRDDGGAARTIAGARALLRAGIDVFLDAPVIASTRPSLPDLPARCRELFGDEAGLRGMTLRVPVDAPDPGELITFADAAAAIATTELRARRAGLPLKLAPDSGPPPCVFPHPAQVAHLYSLTPGSGRRDDHVHPEACSSCQLEDRCSGFPQAYLARQVLPVVRPITDDRMRRRLSLIDSVEVQMQREFVSPSRYHTPAGPVDEKIIRINFQCNQACRFCFVSTHLPTVAHEQTLATIRAAGEEGYRITLSGGEPTLNPHLLEYVKLAKETSRHPVCLQTNATRLEDAGTVGALVAAGLEEVFVSLHGSTAAISDAITEAPGTFAQTVAGIDALARSPVRLILNFVICQKNLHDFVPYVELVAARWPRALLNISFVAPSSDVVPKEKALVPLYSDALPELAAALALAEKRGLTVVGFESMCGLPLCLVPAELNRFFSIADVPEGFDEGEFVKTETCRRCALQTKCYGLRRGYRELHGETELKAVAAP
jgi:molybdenum cofactor biosynthesis enzyme MoaA